MITIAERSEVPARFDDVWRVLSDPHTVVGCVPGASIVRENDDGTFDGDLVVAFGPMRITFHARVTLELDEQSRRGTVFAQGKDAQGGTRMKTSASFAASALPDPRRTAVDLQADIDLSGRLAPLIEGGAAVVAKRMFTEFAARLAARCAETAA